jgi:hypothetical protein
MPPLVLIGKSPILITLKKDKIGAYKCQIPRDRIRCMNNNIPMNKNNDGRVASCIQSPNMLDDGGLNGEIKYPPEIL